MDREDLAKWNKDVEEMEMQWIEMEIERKWGEMSILKRSYSFRMSIVRSVLSWS